MSLQVTLRRACGRELRGIGVKVPGRMVAGSRSFFLVEAVESELAILSKGSSLRV